MGKAKRRRLRRKKRKPTPPRCARQPLPREGARVDTPSFLWKEVPRRGGGWIKCSAVLCKSIYESSIIKQMIWTGWGLVTSDWLAGDIRLILVSSLKALPRNLSCRPLNEECVKAEIRSTKVLFPYRCLCDTDRSARKTLGCASDDGGAKRYQNSAALRSFDSVLLFQISHF